MLVSLLSGLLALCGTSAMSTPFSKRILLVARDDRKQKSQCSRSHESRSASLAGFVSGRARSCAVDPPSSNSEFDFHLPQIFPPLCKIGNEFDVFIFASTKGRKKCTRTAKALQVIFCWGVPDSAKNQENFEMRLLHDEPQFLPQPLSPIPLIAPNPKRIFGLFNNGKFASRFDSLYSAEALQYRVHDILQYR